jgi:hypothetical protein
MHSHSRVSAVARANLHSFTVTRILLFLSAIASLLGSAERVQADIRWEFLRVACVPEISLFEVDSFGLWNVLDEFDRSKHDEPLREGHDIYRLAVLSERTFKCSVADHEIEAGGVYREPQATGECGGAEDASFWLKVDGVVVYETDHINGHCLSPTRLHLQVTNGGVIWCVISTDWGHNFRAAPPLDVDTTCARAKSFVFP